MKIVFLFLISGIIVFLTSLSIRLGYFKSVEISVLEEPLTFHLVYLEHLGPYHKINSSIVKVENLLKEKELPCPQTFGHFLDNPKEMENDRLKSHVGCIISYQTYQKLQGDSSFSQAQLMALSFPKLIKANFEGSPSISPFTVYPAVDDFAESKRLKLKGTTLESYEVTSSTKMNTQYFFPIE